VCVADTQHLSNAFTYCSDDGLRQSWIDHVLCNSILNNRILSVCTLPQFVSSDHKPLLVTFNDFSVNITVCSPVIQKNCCRTSTPDWSKADDYSLLRYESMLNELLSQVNIPVSLLASDYANDSNNHAVQMTDNYYQNVMSCIKVAMQMCIPHSVKGDNHNLHADAGWNDVVRDKHDAARAAFLDWVAAGKPRQGPVFLLMNRTRAAFKLAVQYCRQHEDTIRADILANSIADKEYRPFWKHVHKQQKGNL